MASPIERLYKAVLQAADADPASSRTALLLTAGRGKIGKEVAEEAIEVAFEAMQKNSAAVVHSSADLLFNLVVLWTSIEVEPKHVWKEMNRRARLFGIAEKLAKPRGVPKARRKLLPPQARVQSADEDYRLTTRMPRMLFHLPQAALSDLIGGRRSLLLNPECLPDLLQGDILFAKASLVGPTGAQHRLLRPMARAANSSVPVIIVKKHNQYSFLALPLTTVPKPNPYRLPVGMVDGRQAFATLSQLRNIDSKRLVKKLMHLDADIFIAIKKEASHVNFG